MSVSPEGFVYVGEEGDRSHPLFSGFEEPALDSAALASDKDAPRSGNPWMVKLKAGDIGVPC